MPPEPRVFLTDDNAGLRMTLRDLFADAGIHVVGEAASGIETLRRVPPLASTAPLLVLMDVRMPGEVNGIEASRLLLDRCPGVRVIIFTAFPGAAIEAAAKAAGAVGFLVKGTPADQLIATIRRAWPEAPEAASRPLAAGRDPR